MNSRSDFKCGFSTLLFSSLLSGKKYEIITLVLKPQNGIEFFVIMSYLQKYRVGRGKMGQG